MLDRNDGRLSAATVARHNLADPRMKARLSSRLRLALTGGAALRVARGVQDFFGDVCPGVPILKGHYGLT